MMSHILTYVYCIVLAYCYTIIGDMYGLYWNDRPGRNIGKRPGTGY